MDEKINVCEDTSDVDSVEIAERREKGKQPALCQKPSAGQERPLSDEEAHKVRLVEDACQARDRAALTQLAVSRHGLVLDRLRKTACEFCRSMSSKALLINRWQGLCFSDAMNQGAAVVVKRGD
jgi:hypothetical protein